MDIVAAHLQGLTRLQRERGVALLPDALLAEASPDAAIALLRDLLESPSWEARHGGLLAAACPAVSAPLAGDTLSFVAARAADLLFDHEPCVRLQAGLVMAALCVRGPAVYAELCQGAILESIQENLARVEILPGIDQGADGYSSGEESAPAMVRTAANGRESPRLASAGWRTLETGCQALLEVARVLGAEFAPFITAELLDSIVVALNHANRFARETSYFLVEELIKIAHSNAAHVAVDPAVFDKTLAAQIAIGLSDNWSHVRKSAAVACRAFFVTMPESQQPAFHPLLLPRLCLNRYYAAEGVRLYSQDTWKMVVGDRGKELVEQFASEIVAFYISQSTADNHAVREAACACIAELGAKASPNIIGPHATQLLATLRLCFDDESWPVRDAACVASGRFILAFPAQARALMPDFYPLFFRHVAENISSVRENGAVALGNVCQAFGAEAFAVVLPFLQSSLPAAKTQPESAAIGAGPDGATQLLGVAKARGHCGPAAFGAREQGVARIVYRFGETDPMHTQPRRPVSPAASSSTNSSSANAAPMSPAARRRKEQEYGEARSPGQPPQPWEASDGAIFLLREFAASHTTEMMALLPVLVELSRLRHFKQHFALLETIWKQLPVIAERVGKRAFKQILEDFFPALFYSIESESHLARVAAEQCLLELGKLLGPSILLGRVEQYDARLLPAFLTVLRPDRGGSNAASLVGRPLQR